MAFGIHGDGGGHVRVGFAIDIDVADALVMLDDRDAGRLGDRANQTFAAARHAEVNVFGQGKQYGDGFPVGGRDHLDGFRGKVRDRLLSGIDHDGGNGLI